MWNLRREKNEGAQSDLTSFLRPIGGREMPSSAAVAGRGASAVNAAAAAAAMSSDISRRNPQEDYELLQVRTSKQLHT